MEDMRSAHTWNRNRLKFLLAGPLLECINRFMPGGPHERLVDEVAAVQPRRVLELCGGTAYASRLLSARLPNVEIDSIDISPEMLAVGRLRLHRSGTHNVRLHHADVCELPFGDNTFDVVMSVFGWHELPTDVRHQAIAESSRVLQSGGVIVTVDHDAPPRFRRAYHVHLRMMEPPYAREVVGEGLRDHFVQHRFTVTHHRPATSWTAPFQVVRAEMHAQDPVHTSSRKPP